jgi:hypothetical protein
MAASHLLAGKLGPASTGLQIWAEIALAAAISVDWKLEGQRHAPLHAPPVCLWVLFD